MSRKEKIYALVAPAVPLPATSHQTYTYEVPANEEIKKGQVVQIKFGPRKLTGTVVKVSTDSVPYRTKPLDKITPLVLTPQQLAFGYWIADTMHGGLGYTLRLFHKYKKPILKTALVLVPELWMIDEVQKNYPEAIVDTQKALFLPFQKLEKIIVTHSEYETYKLWDQYPRLNTVRAAKKLAEIYTAELELQSDFPDKKIPLQIFSPSLKDRQDKFLFPTEFVHEFRTWLKKKERIGLFCNRLDMNIKLRRVLHELIPHSSLLYLDRDNTTFSKKQVTLGTSAWFAHTAALQFDRIVWLFPERTLLYPDYRSYERGYALLNRLHALVPHQPVTIITRQPQLVADYVDVIPEEWLRRMLAERKRLSYPPFNDLVQLTIENKTEAATKKRALQIRSILAERGASVDGPYKTLGSQKSVKPQLHLLLRGQLEQLIPLYRDLPIDRVDVDPNRIL